ncbi:pentatricopeptide repeat protein [Purpureocillium lavendulum]|uniref:Pentatricopeptide repeat protein n=1 Tax=Purpureocillium lavendulum TaxID=1247861 RepID=A0AB34G0K6_9HYPO|nr:pentatricopeptide repeat protein [Purpureocillium lavendulum]
MDYHAIHGHDVSSFDAPGAHRLPTVAASQALDEIEHDAKSGVVTGLESLDHALCRFDDAGSPAASRQGSIKRGQVTEIWGPPGTGKTALAIQMTANAICSGNDVVWVDCLQKVQKQRLVKVIKAVHSARQQDGSPAELAPLDWTKFKHYSCFTLPHLMALISRPTHKMVGPGTSLVVIGAASALLNSALPKSQDAKTGFKTGKVLSQCATRMQSEYGATLVAAVNATVWEQGVSTRIVLFRDWAWQDKKLGGVFLAGLQKLDGKPVQGAVEHVSAFKVDAAGTASIAYDAAIKLPVGSADQARHKRKLGQTGLEVPDSDDGGGDDDEDYGWADDDEGSMPAPPPQWQGSEDILLGQEIGRSDDGTCADSEDEGSATGDTD